MKCYWIASTIEIKTTVVPCPEINTNIVIFMSLLPILSHFRPFILIFKVIFTIILGHQNRGPGYENWSQEIIKKIKLASL